MYSERFIILKNSLLVFDEPQEIEKQWKKISGFVKLGKAFDFFYETDAKRNAIGDWECVKLLQLLSNNEPNTKFYILSSSNLHKLPSEQYKNMFPNENVFQVARVGDFKPDYIWINPETQTCEDFYCIGGPNSKVNGVFPIYKNETEIYSPLYMFCRYTGSFHYIFNESKKPVYYFVTDNRYYPKGLDFLIPPKFVMSQLGDSCEVHKGSYEIVNYDKSKEVQSKSDLFIDYDIYPARLESLWLYQQQKETIDLSSKTDKLLIVANQVTNEEKLNKRYDLIKSYVVDQNIECDLIGCWSSLTAQETFKDILLSPDGIPASNLSNVLKKYKFGAIFRYNSVNLKDKVWIVCKIWEYIHNGVLPILVGYPKNSYLDGLPEWCYVNSPDELKVALEYTKKCSDEEFLNIINTILKPEYYSGLYLYNKIKELIDVTK